MKLKKIIGMLSAFAMLCSVSSRAAAYEQPDNIRERYAFEDEADIIRMSYGEKSQPLGYDNTVSRLRPISFLRPCAEGYMRVVADSDSKTIYIEYYTENTFTLISKKTIPFELDIWGGFYESADAYYVVEGTLNKDEIDDAEVIRVIKYDKSWNRLGAASVTSDPSLFGGEVREPFDYGCVEFAEYNGRLYMVTGHEGYVDPEVGMGHQGFLMIEVDETALTGKIVKCDLRHSFAQYAENDNGNIYILEQREGSRCSEVLKYDTSTGKCTSVPVFRYGGPPTTLWARACYATVDDLAVSADNIIGVHSSIDQSQYDTYSSSTKLPYNVYLTVTPKSDFTEKGTVVKQITDYTDGEANIACLDITKINDNRFLLSWGYNAERAEGQTDDNLSHSTLHYIFIDGSGNMLSAEFIEEATASDCHPVLKGDEIVFMSSVQSQVNFYSINAYTGSFSKTIHRVAGENAGWEYDAKTKTLYIIGKGAVSGGSASDIFSTSAGFGEIRNEAERIVIGKGITSVGDYAFYNFAKVREVYMFEGVTRIGQNAFAESKELASIYIPLSVGEIGEDALWGGYYYIGWTQKAYRVEVFAPRNSYAEQYAAQNGIRYTEKDLSKTEGFVERLYTTLLLREYDPKGHADWVIALADGKGASEVAEGFVFSAEITNQDPSSSEFVTRMYLTFLDREPDGAGLADWVNALESGCSYSCILYNFVHSVEFGNICNDYGINRGTYTITEPRDKNVNLTAFVSRMYTKALGRDYDVDGLNDWTGSYLSGENTASDIAYGFIFSTEFKNKNLSDEDYVEVLYETFFDRPSDADGKADWLNRLADGASREDILNGFLGSREFLNLAARFGV